MVRGELTKAQRDASAGSYDKLKLKFEKSAEGRQIFRPLGENRAGHR